MIHPILDRVAHHILACQAQDFPGLYSADLRGITVLLPNYHVAEPLAQAFARAIQAPAVLSPQMVTLHDWAQGIALEAPVLSNSRRSALLYQQLRKSQWFEQADLWSMARELLELFDELTCSLAGLPEDAAGFVAAVECAYQARRNESLQLEARLVFELWHAMQGAELDAARAYQQRLALLARQATRPLYVLRAAEPDAVEQRFFDTYAKQARVTVFDLREFAQQPMPPRFFTATTLEQEARAAALQVRRWLSSGKQCIAIVAQDRMVARRVRALLERAQVLVADETGWTFATLAVSTVLERWLTALQGDFYHHDLLDLLKSPFIFSDLPVARRKAAVYSLEQLLRRQGVVSGLDQFGALATGHADLLLLLERLRQAATLQEPQRKKTLAGWLAALQACLALLAIDAGLRQDDAGQQLLQALNTWQQELAQDLGRYTFHEWRNWLAQQLDAQTYLDCGIASPVCFTHLAATRWRSFDAVLLLGCDADHLPSIADGGSFFNDAVRASLDLPTRADRAARQHDDLRGLFALNDCVLATWQREQDGEQRLLSPFLQMLRDDCERDGMRPDEDELLALLAAEDALHIAPEPSVRPVPRVAPEQVPASLSVSAYNSLVACPYQFYARHILRLNELDEVQEGIEKRDYGERIHKILQCFHEHYPQVSQHPHEEMESALRQLSEDEFADLLAQDFSAHAWLARWFKSLPAYLEWQAQNEASGWRYAGAERDFTEELAGVRLRGRIDRLDANQHERRVLDYKAQGDQLLRNKLKEPGEDVQLACYAYAEEAGEAAFVSIENGKVKAIAPPHEVAQLAQLNAERLVQVMARIRSGAGLPANGIDQACMHCEMRGVCRKGEWA